MTVIVSSRRLKAAVAALFLSIPLAAGEVVMVHRAPWWNLPLRLMGSWSLAFFLVCVPLAFWILGGRRLAFVLAELLAAVWISATLWLALSYQIPALGFFAIFLAAGLVMELSWLRLELSKSYVDPRMGWFEGVPQPIPGLTLSVQDLQSNMFKVARFDLNGAFAFLNSELPEFELGHHGLHLTFTFRNQQLSCVGVPVTQLSRNGGRLGVGFQFKGISADSRKEVGDFLEILRGEGHVP